MSLPRAHPLNFIAPLVAAAGALVPAYTLLAAGVLGVTLLPILGVVLAVSVDGVLLPGLLLFPGMAPLAPWAAACALVLSLIVFASRSRAVRHRVAWLLPCVIFVAAWGIAVGVTNMQAEQVLIGLRFLVLPFVALAVAPALTRAEISGVVHVAGVIVITSAVAALFQNYVGADALVRAGLEYGASVRSVDSILRPPGLFVASYVYGAFAAVSSLIFLGAILARERLRVLYWAYFIAGLGGIVLSTSRFALIIFICGVAVMVLAAGERLSFTFKAAALILALAMVGVFVSVGLSGTESWEVRLGLWEAVLRNVSWPFGDGVGSAGSATLSRVSSERNTVDSYFVSLIFQFGYLGVLISGAAVSIVVYLLARVKQFQGVRLGAIAALTGTVFSFVVTESWEFTSAMCLVLLVLGSPQIAGKGGRPSADLPSTASATLG